MPETEPESEPAPQTPTASASALDLEELARKIFELLLRELLSENERTGR
jgi:hypothetical protein